MIKSREVWERKWFWPSIQAFAIQTKEYDERSVTDASSMAKS
jgi:hypothetical protein